MKVKKTLSSWLTTRYLLIIRNEENFAEKTTFNFTYAKMFVLAAIVFTILFIGSLFLVETVLEQWFDPRYSSIQNNRKLIELSLQLDSLQREMETKERFIQNFKRVLVGESIRDEEEVREEARAAEASDMASMQYENLAVIDSQFRSEFESSDISLLGFTKSGYGDLEEIYFYSPIEGIISSKYDLRNGHHGVDIVAKKNEPVKCVANGTVIFADWTQGSGYVIAVQHASNAISVYKHNAQLLKKVTNFVDAGEIIAIVGNTGELTDGPHLHFELWYNGSPVNPEEFIAF